MALDETLVVWFVELSILALMLFWGYRTGKTSMPSIAGQNRHRQLAAEINGVRNEYKAYRDAVDGQFTDINGTVRDLNKAYGALFQHLADGSQHLSDEGEASKVALEADREFMASVRALPPPISAETAAAIESREHATASGAER